MNKVLNFSPHQSMTMSGTTLQHHKCKSSSLDGIKISCDFQKWCLNQYSGLILSIAKQIDKLSGTPGLYESTHEIPLK